MTAAVIILRYFSSFHCLWLLTKYEKRAQITRPASLNPMHTVTFLVHSPQVMLHSQPLLSSKHVLVPFSLLRWVQPAQSAEWRKRWLVCLYPQSQSSSPRGCSSCLSLTSLFSERERKRERRRTHDMNRPCQAICNRRGRTMPSNLQCLLVQLQWLPVVSVDLLTMAFGFEVAVSSHFADTNLFKHFCKICHNIWYNISNGTVLKSH